MVPQIFDPLCPSPQEILDYLDALEDMRSWHYWNPQRQQGPSRCTLSDAMAISIRGSSQQRAVGQCQTRMRRNPTEGIQHQRAREGRGAQNPRAREGLQHSRAREGQGAQNPMAGNEGNSAVRKTVGKKSEERGYLYRCICFVQNHTGNFVYLYFILSKKIVCKYTLHLSA